MAGPGWPPTLAASTMPSGPTASSSWFRVTARGAGRSPPGRTARCGADPGCGRPPPLSVAVAPNVGDQVLAYGSPFGLPDTVTKGIVSAVQGDYIQTDAQ